MLLLFFILGNARFISYRDAILFAWGTEFCEIGSAEFIIGVNCEIGDSYFQ